MRVAIVTETFLPKMDGIVRTLLQLLEHLRQNGHQALVIAPGPGPAVASGFPVRRVDGIRFPLYPEITLAPIAPAVGRWLDAFEPDIVHLAGPCVLGMVATLAGRHRNLPMAAHFQTDLPGYAAHFGYPPLTEPLWRYLSWLHNLAGATYAPTRAIALELDLHGMKNVRISGRGVDTVGFSPASRNGDCAEFLYVGRVSPEKNIDWLAHIAHAFPTQRLRIVGDGPGLEPLRKKLASRPNVDFTGALAGAELARAFASAEVFLFPSHTETFGQVVQEAMASGLPVVGVAAGGVGDLVRPGETGLLARPGDVASFIAAAGQLLADEDKRREMGRHARRFAEQQSWQAVFDRLLAEYRDLIDQQRKRST